MSKKTDIKSRGKFEEQLPVVLTEVELLERGAKMAQVDSDLRDHRQHADSVKKTLKSKETALESERSRLAAIVRAKSEPRPVEVERLHDLGRRLAYDVRTDTGEVIPGSTRPLREEDLQGEFDDVVPFEAIPASLKPAKKARAR